MFDLLDYAQRMLVLSEPAVGVMDTDGNLLMAPLNGRSPHGFFARAAEQPERFTMALVFSHGTAVDFETGVSQRVSVGAAITRDGATTVMLTPDGVTAAVPTEGALLDAARAALA